MTGAKSLKTTRASKTSRWRTTTTKKTLAPSNSSSFSNKNKDHHQLSGDKKLFQAFIKILLFGLITFVIAYMTDTNAHIDEEQSQKEKLLGEFLQTTTFKNGHDKHNNVVYNDIHIHHHIEIKNDVNKEGQRAIDNVDNDNNHPPYHVVFSTSCNNQQHWESYVLFYHANKVNQSGTVTRIVSGCNKEETDWLNQFHQQHIQTLNPNFYVHFTPDYSSLTRQQKLGDMGRYKYLNKPFGLKDWMEKVLRMGQSDQAPDVEDGIVILMDPDQILLRPIVHDFTNEDVIYAKGDNPDWKIVTHGNPMAQQDGYLGNQWMNLNISFVTHGGNIDHISKRVHGDGSKYWNAGPPYLATVRDMYNIAILWVEYAPRVYHIHPKLFAEMYGYIIATTQLHLSHTLIKSIVVSTTTTPAREGWPYIDAIPEEEICDSPHQHHHHRPLPIAIHYCKRYFLDKWFFSKYRLKKEYISCETPLLTAPPKDLAAKNITYTYQPPPHEHRGEWDPPRKDISSRQAKREAFMVCNLIQSINEAAIYFKISACNGTANMATNYTFFSDPDH